MITPEILQNLKDIHVPPAPSFWPLAPGFYVLITVFCGLVVLAYLLWRRMGSRLRRRVLSELLLIESAFRTGNDVARLQASLTALLRRMLFQKNPGLRKDLEIVDLKPFLFAMFPDKKGAEEVLNLLAKDRFLKNPNVNGQQLLKLFREQIARCRI